MADSIRTFDTYDRQSEEQRVLRMRRRAVKLGYIIPRHINRASEDDPIIYARINHGRWIADCPSQFCAGAELAREDGLFMCLSCFNRSFGNRYLNVEFPKNRKALENELLKRRIEENRNWHPGETLAALKKENKDHGVDES